MQNEILCKCGHKKKDHMHIFAKIDKKERLERVDDCTYCICMDFEIDNLGWLEKMYAKRNTL